jgi:hypothetical protein
MSRRIWVAEGFASDGDVYGRSLQLPTPDVNKNDKSHLGGSEIQRTQAAVLKSNLGDIPSCPCLSAIIPEDHDTASRGS